MRAVLPGKPGCPHHLDFRGYPRANARGVPALPPRLDKGTGGRAVGTKEALAMNIVNLVGRLAKDPVARDRSDTRITELILVTERPVIRDGKVQKDPETGYPVKDAEFHKVTIFNGMGLPLRQHKAKGDQLAVTGRIHYSRWQDAEGNDRYGCEIIAENVEFL
jgi:single-strand DNA-binding protein